MKKIGLFGSKKGRKTLAVHDLGKECLNEEVGGKIMSGEVGCPIGKIGKVIRGYYLQIIYLFLQIL